MLRFKHVVLIVAVAVVGIVVGYVFTSSRFDSHTQPKSLDASIAPGTTPTKALAAVGAPTSVPDLHGKRLPDAISALANSGYRNVRSEDATPQKRLIVEQQNWVVDSQDPPAGTAVPTNTQIVLRVKKGTDDAVPAPTSFGVVPNVVCAELQAAQDALRGSGFLLITSTDGTGQGRVAAIDRNWVVTEQSVPAGTSPGITTHIVLTVVKHGESAGSSGCQT